MLLTQVTAAESKHGILEYIKSVFKNAEYCNKPGKWASSFLLVHLMAICLCGFVQNLPEIEIQEHSPTKAEIWKWLQVQ